MVCKLVPSSITTEGIINTTVIVGHITTIWTAAGILEEMTEAVVVAVVVEGVVATAAAEAVVNLVHNVKHTQPLLYHNDVTYEHFGRRSFKSSTAKSLPFRALEFKPFAFRIPALSGLPMQVIHSYQ